METAAIIIAGYAAIVATGSLAWQVYLWRHRRRSHIEVKAAIALMGGTGGSIEVISITATNRSEHPVRAEGAGLDMQDGSGRQLHVMQPMPGATIPGVIAPHDSGTAYLLKDETEQQGLSVFEPVTAWVRLATGDVVKSPSRPLMRRD